MSNKRKQISKSMKRKCWETYNGHKYQSKCFISWCNNKITVWEFHTGHILADIRGGNPTIENLRPICSLCNTSMGDMNMKEFDTYYSNKEKRKELSKKYDRRRSRSPVRNDGYIQLGEKDDTDDTDDSDNEEYTQEEMFKDIRQIEKDLNELKIQYNTLYNNQSVPQIESEGEIFSCCRIF